jgi:hypothetical protein
MPASQPSVFLPKQRVVIDLDGSSPVGPRPLKPSHLAMQPPKNRVISLDDTPSLPTIGPGKPFALPTATPMPVWTSAEDAYADSTLPVNATDYMSQEQTDKALQELLEGCVPVSHSCPCRAGGQDQRHV